jgi:hypothetical protein
MWNVEKNCFSLSVVVVEEKGGKVPSDLDGK